MSGGAVRDPRRSKSKLRRTVRFNMLLTEEEAAQLVEIANTQGLSSSDWLRQIIRHTWHTWKGGTPMAGWIASPEKKR